MSIIKIQTTIAGYSGKPCSLFSGYDLEKRILHIHAETDFSAARKEGCVVITNDKALERDVLFTEASFQEAIRLYFDMEAGIASDGASKRLNFSEKTARARPNSSLEKGDINETGQKYIVNQGISSLQVAAIATCWYCHSKAELINKVVNEAQEFNDLWRASQGAIFTF